MRGRIAVVFAMAATAGAWGAGRASAQVTLADDIILAAKAKQNAEESHRTSLGRTPGTAASPYRRSPGSTDVDLGADPRRRPATPPRLARLAPNPSPFTPPPQEPAAEAHGLAPVIERLRLSPAASGAAPPAEETAEPEGPPGGLTLDAAIDRLLRENRDLRTKGLEIPQAEADVLTAGLRENPLLFYSTGGVPYGSYSPRRTGEVDSGISLVLPVDYTGKRRARVALARKEKEVLEAQYRNAARLAIDELYTAYVDALAARQSVRVSEDGLRLIDEVLKNHPPGPAATEAQREELDDLNIERDVASMAVEDAHERLQKAMGRLGLLLECAPGEAEALGLRGTLRVAAPRPPAAEELIPIALGHRPDLAAFRLGVERACAELGEEKSERFSDAYLLYTPMDYLDRSRSRELSVNTWGAGVFVSLPLFNRNQGNLRRARLNVVQSRNEADHAAARVAAEVRQAARDVEHTLGDVERLEGVTIPAIRRKRDRARARLRAGQIGPDDFLAVQRETSELVRYYRETLVRHRRNTLHLNTAVGLRVMP